MEYEIDRFECYDDKNKSYEIIVYQKMINAGTMSDPHAKIPGLKRLVLIDGSAVNHIDDETFQIVVTGQLIRKAA